jgi:hypothetical protein
MKRNIFLAIALLASINASATYLFLNVTHRGHVVYIDGKAIKNNESASMMEKKNYKVVVKENSGKERETIFNPKENSGKVVAITFNEILRKPHAKQYTLEVAKKKYEGRIQF